MKLLGGAWSRGDVFALLGVIAAVLAIPGMPKLFHWDSDSPYNPRHASPTAGQIKQGTPALLPQAARPDYRFVNIPSSNVPFGSIQENVVNTFPFGIFKANNELATPFKIPSTPGGCGYSGIGVCNFYGPFGLNGNGLSITITASIPNVTHVYTLMNATSPRAGAQIAMVEFFGSGGATETFPLVAGQDIRDYYQGNYANTLSNGIPGVRAVNAFSCVDPTTCLGSGGTGNVNTGLRGTYVLDEQQFSLSSAFQTQYLTKIVITATSNGNGAPVLLGITTQ